MDRAEVRTPEQSQASWALGSKSLSAETPAVAAPAAAPAPEPSPWSSLLIPPEIPLQSPCPPRGARYLPTRGDREELVEEIA